MQSRMLIVLHKQAEDLACYVRSIKRTVGTMYCDARTASNLGAMQDSLKGQPSDADIKAMQEVPNRGSAFEGIYFDGPAVLGSSVLLSVLLFLSLERVLGLDQWLTRVRQSWDEKKQDKEKWEVYDARRRLEENFSSTDEAADDKS
jgi:hypothetical protein